MQSQSRLLFVVLALFLSACSVPQRGVVGSAPLGAHPGERMSLSGAGIGRIRSVGPQGCGCYFSARASSVASAGSPAYLFISDATGKAYVNVNGSDVVLKEVGRRFGPDEYGYCSSGRCVYTSNGLTAVIEMRKAQVCPPEPSECEVTDYDGTLVINSAAGNYRRQVSGFCGC